MTAESFRPQFTTSASYHQEIAEEREEELGAYFGDRVRTVTGSVEPVKQSPAPRPVARTHTPAEPKPLTDRQKRMLKPKR